MIDELSREQLEKIVQAWDLSQLSFQDMVTLFLDEGSIREHAPSGDYAIDPRNGERILFHPLRGSRPVDYQGTSDANSASETQKNCMICRGDTTGVIDAAKLSEGYTFINKNLYPMVYPQPNKPPHQRSGWDAGKPVAEGLHFLQWTSTRHDKDWHNMSLDDLKVVFQRLAALEKLLLHLDSSNPKEKNITESDETIGPVVSLIKNGGAQVGGSLTHGHQQIAYTNLVPRRILEDRNFNQTHGVPFSEYLLRETPDDLVIMDFDTAVWLIPPFMRRPYNSILAVRDTAKQHLHQLTVEEVEGVCRGWQAALRAIHHLLPSMGRPTAYNVISHNGPGAGIYFEFLPYTQERGGFEQLGLSVCQSDPKRAAEDFRKLLPG